MNSQSNTICPSIMTDSIIGLSPELFTVIFPFHVAFDHNHQLVQLGNALQQICPDVAVGNPFEQHFQMTHPVAFLDFETIQQQTGLLFVLEILRTRMQFKGQMLYVPEHKVMLFLGAPWIADWADLAPLGLELTNFLIHHPVADYLFLLQSQKAALAKTQLLTEKLAQQQVEMHRAVEKEKELNDMKSRFITNTSHEFRTPLGIISSSAGILQDYGQRVNDELRQKHLLRIQSAVKQITALLEDVLLMNRLEQNNLE